MIKNFNFKDNYNLINNKFVNLFKNLKTSYLGFNNTNLGLTKKIGFRIVLLKSNNLCKLCKF